MKLTKTLSAFVLSFILLLGTFSQANAKRLTAAVADWTGGEIFGKQEIAMPLRYKYNHPLALKEIQRQGVNTFNTSKMGSAFTNGPHPTGPGNKGLVCDKSGSGCAGSPL